MANLHRTSRVPIFGLSLAPLKNFQSPPPKNTTISLSHFTRVEIAVSPHVSGHVSHFHFTIYGMHGIFSWTTAVVKWSGCELFCGFRGSTVLLKLGVTVRWTSTVHWGAFSVVLWWTETPRHGGRPNVHVSHFSSLSIFEMRNAHIGWMGVGCGCHWPISLQHH